MKPGIKTTEFWMTILNAVFMVLLALGVVGQEEAGQLEDLLGPVIGGVLPLVLYIWSRTKVKQANGG